MEDPQKLYEDILQTANFFLHSAKRWHISILKDFNPSFPELAAIMRNLAQDVHDLADDFDPMLAQKALEYAHLMDDMSIAILNDDKVRLSELVTELDKKPFI